ncbi:MAG: hypothetical protein Ct9H90mP9_0380 [Pseudomonadota bacterium]|nr:MAG: hypothetical protein Ct9H90mP9_0380 [Pseudomonadota bacterium]
MDAPDEIERIIDFLLNEHSLNCIFKFNPTLLGEERVRELLQGVMGYEAVNVPSKAFKTRTLPGIRLKGFVQRLGVTAAQIWAGFRSQVQQYPDRGESPKFFPGIRKGNVSFRTSSACLATNLVDRFRDRFGDHYPISFSAGIDRKNFAERLPSA